MADTPGNHKVSRRLVAILAADIAGYSALMGADEEATVRDLKAHQVVVLPMINDHGGRIIDTAGDGILAEFGSVVNAVECAVAIQETMAVRNANAPADRRMQFRIGINLGDVIHDEQRVYGEGVNIAARLEGIAEPGGIRISGTAYEHVHKKLQLNFTDLGAQSVKNIAEPVRVYRVDAGQLAVTGLSTKVPLALPDKPSIAVLPFTNMSGDSKEDYFSDGISEDIITELSRFSELFVIARNSSFQYKEKSPDIRQVGRELGVRYVLEGSIRRAGNRVRITGQLIDATTGAHRWAERYDRNLEDVFAVQDEVTRSIVRVLVAHVNNAEIERTLLKPAAIWHAYDLYLRALHVLRDFWALFRYAPLYEARDLLTKATTVDPNFASAYVTLSLTYVTAFINALDTDYMNPAALDRAHDLARRAVQLDPNLAPAHAQLGWVLLFRREYDSAVLEIERALSLNPNFSDWRFGQVYACAGKAEFAIELISRHMRFDPFYPAMAPLWLGAAHYLVKEYARALPVLQECVSRAPDWRPARIWLAATFARLGLLEKARAEATEALRIDPGWTISGRGRLILPMKRPADAEHFFDGVREAGLPER